MACWIGVAEIAGRERTSAAPMFSGTRSEVDEQIYVIDDTTFCWHSFAIQFTCLGIRPVSDESGLVKPKRIGSCGSWPTPEPKQWRCGGII